MFYWRRYSSKELRIEVKLRHECHVQSRSQCPSCVTNFIAYSSAGELPEGAMDMGTRLVKKETRTCCVLILRFQIP